MDSKNLNALFTERGFIIKNPSVFIKEAGNVDLPELVEHLSSLEKKINSSANIVEFAKNIWGKLDELEGVINLDDYASHIDTNVGFCSDRNMANGYTWSSQPSHNIYYAAYERLVNSRSPSLGCSSNDVIKEPVGLITADEVVFAGVGTRSISTGYYLYTGQIYWTMSPALWNFDPAMFYVGSNGGLGSNGSLTNTWGVRPVINLTADTKFTGNGTASDPYTIS